MGIDALPAVALSVHDKEKTMKSNAAILTLLLAVSAWSLEKPRLGGYLENQTSVQFDSTGTISDIATLRLEGSWGFGARGGVETHLTVSAALQPLDLFATFRDGSVMERIAAELMSPYETLVDSVYSQLWPDVRGRLDPVTAATLDALMAEVDTDDFLDYLPYSSMYPRDRVRLDRAVVKLYLKPFDLYVGRQVVAWGTGYGWNPTDMWNVKSPADPTAPKRGINALRAEIPLGAASGISLVVTPGPNLDHTSGGIRIKGHLGRFDMSLSGMRVLTADHALLRRPARIMAGADMAGEIGDVGVWAEGVVVNPTYLGGDYTNFDSLYVQADAGLNYTFDNGLYIMAEYHYNGLGSRQPQDYDAFGLLRLFAGDMTGLGQHYAMAGATKDLFDDWMVELFGLGNLSDRSFLVLPSVEYMFHQNIAVKIGARVSIGDREESEYGSLYHSGYLRVTGWF